MTRSSLATARIHRQVVRAEVARCPHGVTTRRYQFSEDQDVTSLSGAAGQSGMRVLITRGTVPAMTRFLILAALLTGSAAHAVDAKAVAAKVLDSTVLSVSALTTKQGEFIGALSREYDGAPVTVSLLRKVGALYVVQWSNPTGQEMDQTPPTITLGDTNRDGSPELLWNYGAYGNSAGGQFFKLYDTARKRTYEASISENYGAPGTGTVTYDPALLEPANAALLAFVVSRVEKNPAFPKPDAKDPYGDMLRAWAAQNGAINAPGARFVAAKPVPAPASSCADDPRSRTAKITLGGLTYLAVFKSGVFVLDPKKKTCALVYFPPDTDSVYFANNPECHRIAGSTSGTRVAPSRVRSD